MQDKVNMCKCKNVKNTAELAELMEERRKTKRIGVLRKTKIIIVFLLSQIVFTVSSIFNFIFTDRLTIPDFMAKMVFRNGKELQN